MAKTNKPRGYWKVKENAIEEARKYTTRTEFARNSPSAYNTINDNDLWDDVPWIQLMLKEVGYWQNKENTMNEARQYKTIAEFAAGSASAYVTAKQHGWIKEMTWLERKVAEVGYWKVRAHVEEVAKKCKTRSEFRSRFYQAAVEAKKAGYFDELNFEQPQIKQGTIEDEPVHCIYGYFDDINKYAYIGATKSLRKRHLAHRRNRKNEPVYNYFKNKGLEIPYPTLLEDGLRPVERQDRERYWSLFYRDQGYTLLNRIELTGVGVGSLGSGFQIWSDEEVYKVLRKCKTITELQEKYSGAADAAYSRGLISIEKTPWFYETMRPKGWWNDKEHVFEEAHKYKTWKEFYNGSYSAYSSARRHGWKEEITWLVYDYTPIGFWQNDENVIEESKKYKSKKEFENGCSSAYDAARKRNLLSKMTWLQSKRVDNGYWKKLENIIKAAKRCSTLSEFMKKYSAAYNSTIEHGWKEHISFLYSDVKPNGYWKVKENVIEESKKYKTRTAFCRGCGSAYQEAVKHDYFSEMPWIAAPNTTFPVKYTDDEILEEARRYNRPGEFKKANPNFYAIALERGLRIKMIWFDNK